MAVKKDRAAEPLLSPGAKFIVNIMAEGNERPLMKQLLKPFKPGEDRFAGLDIEVRYLRALVSIPPQLYSGAYIGLCSWRGRLCRRSIECLHSVQNKQTH